MWIFLGTKYLIKSLQARLFEALCFSVALQNISNTHLLAVYQGLASFAKVLSLLDTLKPSLLLRNNIVH